MDFNVTPEQEAIRAAVAKVCATFDLDYWLKKDSAGGFPSDFHAALARDGDAYVVSGRKIWTSAAQVANKMRGCSHGAWRHGP